MPLNWCSLLGGISKHPNSEIQEIQILGDWAYMWTKLAVEVTPPGGAATMNREKTRH